MSGILGGNFDGGRGNAIIAIEYADRAAVDTLEPFDDAIVPGRDPVITVRSSHAERRTMRLEQIEIPFWLGYGRASCHIGMHRPVHGGEAASRWSA